MRDQPFFIFGMPRSRTAWLANLFCCDAVHCFHEISKRPPWDIQKTLESSAKDWVGLSEPNMLVFEEAVGLYPEARVAVIDRPVFEVYNSLKRFVPDAIVKTVMHQQGEAMEAARQQGGARWFKYDDLNSVDHLLSMWNYLAPRVVPDMERTLQLMQFNVQVSYGMAT
jgi:hypothetical protein